MDNCCNSSSLLENNINKGSERVEIPLKADWCLLILFHFGKKLIILRVQRDAALLWWLPCCMKSCTFGFLINWLCCFDLVPIFHSECLSGNFQTTKQVWQCFYTKPNNIMIVFWNVICELNNVSDLLMVKINLKLLYFHIIYLGIE